MNQDRIDAMKWWNNLTINLRNFYAGDRQHTSLTGREIQIIYKRLNHG